MGTASIQDRTPEFRSILAQAQKRLAQQPGKRPIQNARPNETPSDPPRRSDFARKAGEIGRGIAATVSKLERLGQLAKRKTLFDDRPIEINQLTFVIKQDLAGLNQQIGALSQLSKRNHPTGGKGGDQEGQHNENVVVMLQGRLADVGVNFKEVLEVRTKNIQASRSRQDNFVSTVSQHGQSLAAPGRTDSPLYSQPGSRGRSPGGTSTGGDPDLLSLEPPSGSSALGGGTSSEQQMLLLEEGQSNSYIQQRGQAIEAIESTINELGSIFGQLAQMVSEQSEMIQRIDANTDDVVTNVE